MFSLFKRGGLRAWILALLRLSPKNGTEIMDHIEMASQGWWRPSPGSVYPLLEELSRDGFIRKREDGRYEMTEKSVLEPVLPPWGNYTKVPRTPQEIVVEMESNIAYLEDKVRVDKTNIGDLAGRLQNIKVRIDEIIQQKN